MLTPLQEVGRQRGECEPWGIRFKSMKNNLDALLRKRALSVPKIRLDLEPFQYHDQNDNVFVTLKDPLELSPRRILIPQDLYYLVRFFDGRHSLEILLEKYHAQFNRALQSSRLTKMIKKLDQSLLLDNDRSKARKEHLRCSFAAQKIRLPACAGSSYPDNPEELRQGLQGYFEKTAGSASIRAIVKDKTIKAIIAPHIDPRLGGPVYAAAYQALQASNPADVYVILGISHQPTQRPFVLTKKDFQTPMGSVHTDGHFVEKLLARCNVDYLEDEFVHRDEHSIEFQTIFLQRQLGANFRIVPVLASFSHIRTGAEDKEVKDFVHALKGVADEHSGAICFIASVDLSHIGARYGDNFEPDSFILSQVEKSDRNVLDALQKQNLVEFERHFLNDGNKYHICGYPALRTLLGVLSPLQSFSLRYDNAIMDEQRSTVTFASMIFI